MQEDLKNASLIALWTFDMQRSCEKSGGRRKHDQPDLLREMQRVFRHTNQWIPENKSNREPIKEAYR